MRATFFSCIYTWADQVHIGAHMLSAGENIPAQNVGACMDNLIFHSQTNKLGCCFELSSPANNMTRYFITKKSFDTTETFICVCGCSRHVQLRRVCVTTDMFNATLQLISRSSIPRPKKSFDTTETFICVCGCSRHVQLRGTGFATSLPRLRHD